MGVYLVRHACAGDKRQWSGPDEDRPLDATGLRQSQGLADELARVPIHRILSSPARRCIETVDPLARRLDVPIEPLVELLPDGDPKGFNRMIVALDARAAAVCTHGELMRPVLAAIRQNGTSINAKQDDDRWLLQKGTARSDRVRRGTTDRGRDEQFSSVIR
jgi:8-oxo-dGTP diphosphatase